MLRTLYTSQGHKQTPVRDMELVIQKTELVNQEFLNPFKVNTIY